MKGTVIKTTGSWYLVKSEKGIMYDCKIKGKLRLENINSTNPVVVGDIVDFNIENNNLIIEEGTYHIKKNLILPRGQKLIVKQGVSFLLFHLQSCKLLAFSEPIKIKKKQKQNRKNQKASPKIKTIQK